MNILSIYASHDGCVTYIKNKKIAFHTQIDRYNRFKYFAFPNKNLIQEIEKLKIDKIRTKGDKKMDEIRLKITGRSDKAGGGIMKMAGDDSGPPPKSGPTPHGLPYVAKNVRPIKERK